MGTGVYGVAGQVFQIEQVSIGVAQAEQTLLVAHRFAVAHAVFYRSQSNAESGYEQQGQQAGIVAQAKAGGAVAEEVFFPVVGHYHVEAGGLPLQLFETHEVGLLAGSEEALKLGLQGAATGGIGLHHQLVEDDVHAVVVPGYGALRRGGGRAQEFVQSAAHAGFEALFSQIFYELEAGVFRYAALHKPGQAGQLAQVGGAEQGGCVGVGEGAAQVEGEVPMQGGIHGAGGYPLDEGLGKVAAQAAQETAFKLERLGYGIGHAAQDVGGAALFEGFKMLQRQVEALHGSGGQGKESG